MFHVCDCFGAECHDRRFDTCFCSDGCRGDVVKVAGTSAGTTLAVLVLSVVLVASIFVVAMMGAEAM